MKVKYKGGRDGVTLTSIMYIVVDELMEIFIDRYPSDEEGFAIVLLEDVLLRPHEQMILQLSRGEYKGQTRACPCLREERILRSLG